METEQPIEQGKKMSEVAGSYQQLQKLVIGIKRLQDSDRDCIIFLSGQRGEGKSTAGIQIARQLCEIRGIKFDLNKHLAYTGADVNRMVKEAEEFSPIVCDESANFAMGMDWAKSENKALVRLFIQCRTRHLCLIFCCPKLTWLNKKFQRMATFWIKMYGRGIGGIFVSNSNEGIDPWQLDKLLGYEGFYSVFSAGDNVLERIKRHPNFFDEVHFPKLPREIEEKYLELRNRKVFEEDASESTGLNTLQIAVYNIKKLTPKTIPKSYEAIVEHIFKNPLTGEVVISHDTARRWNLLLDREVENKKEEDARKSLSNQNVRTE